MVESDPDYEKCIEKAGNVFGEAMETVQDRNNWEQVQANNDSTCYSRPSEYGFNIMKVDGYLEKSVSQIVDYIFNNWPHIATTVGAMAEIRVIKSFADGSRIRYDKSPSFGPASARESYIYSSKQQIDDNSWVILDTSSPIEMPISADCVQAELKYRIQVFEPLDDNPNRTHYKVCEIIDPKGNIPSMIVSKISKGRAKFWKRLIEHLKTVQQLNYG